jgi:hypothetical protein
MLTLDLAVEEGDAFLAEGEVADEEGVEDDSAAPHVDGSALVLLLADDLGRGVVGRPAGSLEQPSVLHKVGESEVDDLHHPCCVDEDVLGFEVAVGDEVGVGVADALNHLSEEELHFVVRNLVVLHVVEQLSALRQLHHHEDIVRRVQNLVQLDYVGVTDELQDFYLPFHLRPGCCTFEIMFLFRILRLFSILMATLIPVRSCLASTCGVIYL